MLVALVFCGFLVPAALGAPTSDAPSAPQPLANGAVPGAAPQGLPAPDPAATATSGQTAGSAAAATQAQPTNVVVIVRVESPGNDGPVTQSNVTVGTSNTGNGATTSQQGAADAAPTPPQAATDQAAPTAPQTGSTAGQEASTAQQAGSSATATQDAAGNLVVTVRIDSPGRDPAVTQTNNAVGSSGASNTSATDQQAAAPEPAVAPQTRGEGAAKSRERPQRRHRHPSAAARAAAGSTSAPATMRFVERATPARAAVPAAPAHRQKSVSRPGARREVPVLSGIEAAAARVLSPLLPSAPTAATAARPEDASRAIVFTLVALAAAAATFVALRRAPRWRRATPGRARR